MQVPSGETLAIGAFGRSRLLRPPLLLTALTAVQLALPSSCLAQVIDDSATTPASIREDSASTPAPLFTVSGGVGTWNAGGVLMHLQVSVEHAWQPVGLNLIAEGGLMMGGGLGALTLTPGASLDLSSRPGRPYVRAGFSMFRTENLGFHVGGGFKTASLESGIRGEVRMHVFPGGEDTDFALEGLVTYQVPF